MYSVTDEEGDEENPGESPPKRSKITEKCKFWPACVNGNACSYHHPTVPCRYDIFIPYYQTLWQTLSLWAEKVAVLQN